MHLFSPSGALLRVRVLKAPSSLAVTYSALCVLKPTYTPYCERLSSFPKRPCIGIRRKWTCSPNSSPNMRDASKSFIVLHLFPRYILNKYNLKVPDVVWAHSNEGSSSEDLAVKMFEVNSKQYHLLECGFYDFLVLSIRDEPPEHIFLVSIFYSRTQSMYMFTYSRGPSLTNAYLISSICVNEVFLRRQNLFQNSC